ncbi:MAG TPA: GNAT family N-acetyltransferase [Rhodanobacteraceae bacterium]
MAEAHDRDAILIRAAAAADREFILALATRLVSFPLPRGRSKHAALAATRTALRVAWQAATTDEQVFISTTPRGARSGFLRLKFQRDFFSGEPACHVSELVVAKRYEGRGIGRALLEHAQHVARERHCTLLTLGVFAGNARARRLYAQLGFHDELIRMLKPVRHTR